MRRIFLILVTAAIVMGLAVSLLQQPSPVKAASQTWYWTDYLSGMSGANYRMILGSGNGSTPGGSEFIITAGNSKIWAAASSSSADQASNMVCHMSGTWSVTIKAKGSYGVKTMTLIVDIGILSGGIFTSEGNSGNITVTNGWFTYTFNMTTSSHTVNPGQCLALKVTATGTSDIWLDLHNSSGNGPCYATSPSGADTYPGMVNIDFTVTDFGTAGIQFGSLNPAVVNQPAADQDGSHGAVALNIGADTNVNVNVQLCGTNFTSGENTIAITNVLYNNTNSTSGASTLTANYVIWYSVNANTADTRQCYHWISIPAGQAAGTYTSIFSYQAVQQ